MIRVRVSTTVAAAAALLFSVVPTLAAGCLIEEGKLIQHRLTIDLFPDLNRAEMTDSLYLPDGVTEILLSSRYQVTALSSEGNLLPFVVEPLEEEADLNRIILEEGLPAAATLVVSASGSFYESTEGTTFSHENVGREISATISEEGIYLSGSEGWYPLIGDQPGCFQTTISCPDNLDCLTDGDLVSRSIADDRKIAVWETTQPTDGLILIGGRYYIDSRETSDGRMVYTWLLSDDPDLKETYLTHSVRYIEMYSRMLSPYPYQRFTVVENFFPTGYGMPGWTLLGGDVIRLPFIPYTSLGHEILHNWWGNSVFVDSDLGNWCEGLTVYQADYLYKMQRDAEEGKRYRKNTLKQFTSYINTGNDIPLVEFRERHSAATRAIGYGKSMMLFHMIHERIGADAFLAALQSVINTHSFQRASFSDFIQAFNQSSGQDLTDFCHSWLHQSGAAQLTLGKTDWNGRLLALELLQREPIYPLSVPVRLTTTEGTQDITLEFSSAREEYQIPVSGLQRLEIDPDYHLFRFLHPEEMEPSLEQALAETAPMVIPGSGSDAEAASLFAGAICETFSEELLLDVGTILPESGTCYLYNPQRIPDGLPVHFELQEGQVVFNGEVYDLATTTLVLLERRTAGEEQQTVAVIFNQGDPTSLGRRLKHYGKYSWLVFQNGRNSGKGYWPVLDSPLIRDWQD